MNAYTKMSDKGQVVVPKATRTRLGWEAGLDLEVIETTDGVMLRPREVAGRLTVEEAVERFRELHRYEGPPVSLDQMRADAAAMAAGEDHIAG